MAENILTMENIVKTYKMGDEQQTVLKGIDLQVDKGEFVAILGPSGSGKSTLMNIIGCLDTATSGTYHLHGRDVSALSESELARVRSKEIGFIFQSFQLLQRQDALQNVELPLIYAGMSGHERAARAQQMLERVGLKDKMHHFPNQLSGVGISAMPQSFDSSIKSRMLDEVSDCASLMPDSRSGTTTRSAPIFSSARRCVSSVALHTTLCTPSSLRFSVATTLVARSPPMAMTAQS